MPLINCPACDNRVSSQANSCPQCGHPIKKERSKTPQEERPGVIHCPNCRRTNVKKISTGSKVGSVALWGVFSMGKLTKTYECKACGYRW